MSRPDFTLLSVPDAVQRLTCWLEPQMPPKLLHAHEKIGDAELIAVAVLRLLHRHPYFSRWWSLMRTNFCPHDPNLTQAVIRLARLTPLIE